MIVRCFWALERCSFVCCSLFAVHEVRRNRVNEVEHEAESESETERLALNEKAKKFEIRVNEAR